MKNKNPLISLALLLLTLLIVVGTAATLVATDGSEQVRMAMLEVSSTPRGPNIITTEPPNNPPSSTPIPGDPPELPTHTLVPSLPPEAGCAAAPSQFGNAVNIRQEPGVTSEIIGSMDFRWYPQDISKPPAVADDGNGDDADGNLWFAVKMPNGETGWVARRVVQTSQHDCFGNGVLVTCRADIQALAPDQLPDHDIVFFGENCELIDKMLYTDSETDGLQNTLSGSRNLCPAGAVNSVYLGARAMVRRDVTATAVPICKPDITISKSSNVAEISPGGSVVYTIHYSNNGNGKATNVVISDALPAGGVPDCGSTPCDLNSTAFEWNIGDLKAGESGSLSYSVQFPNVEPGSLITNSASISFGDSLGSRLPPQFASVTVRVIEGTVTPPPPQPTSSDPSAPTATPTPTPTPTEPPQPPPPIPIPTDVFALFVEQSKSDASQTTLVFIGPDRYVAFTYPLSIEGPIHYPALSPDGRRLAFLQNTKDGWMLNSLTLPTSEGGEVQKAEIKEQPLLLSQEGLSIVPGQIAWSPDSTMLLITMRDDNRLDNVYWVDAVEKTSPAQRATGLFIANASQPAYSPSMHPEVENDGLIAVVRSGRIFITRQKPTLLREPGLTIEQVEERQIVIEDSLRPMPETPSCASQSQPAFNYTDEYPLYFVCERGGAGAALYLYTEGEPQQLDLSLEISPIQNLGPLRGWYITFDDGEEIYMVQIEPDTTNVLETISLDLSSQRRNALYMNWLSIAEPLG